MSWAKGYYTSREMYCEWAIDADELRRQHEEPVVTKWKVLQPDKERIIAVLKGIIPEEDYRRNRLEEGKEKCGSNFGRK